VPKTLVEAPNYQLYTHWLYQQPDVNAYTMISSEAALRGYKGEVIVLNGGSMDPSIRGTVRRMEVAGQFFVSRREVLHEFSVPLRVRH